MSVDLKRLQFFSTPAHPCSYLDEQHATTLFLDPREPLRAEVYAPLSALGFRRSGQGIYRPHCHTCRACIPARVVCAAFEPNRQQRRVLQRNQDVEVQCVAPYFSDEIYALYARYIEARHADGDMFPPSPEQFRDFLLVQTDFSYFAAFRVQGRLIAVAVMDILPNGISAVYTFFDPHEASRSMGRFAILWQIAEAQRRQLPALYLGYWIRDCRKMRYKTEYQPLELYVNQRWILMT